MHAPTETVRAMGGLTRRQAERPSGDAREQKIGYDCPVRSSAQATKRTTRATASQRSGPPEGPRASASGLSRRSSGTAAISSRLSDRTGRPVAVMPR